MSGPAKILIATDVSDDASLVRKLLRDEFEAVTVSSDAACAVQDFEKVRPDVLILAYKTLEQSERYYLGLYRLSKQVHAIPHRTLILCDKNDLQRVYALCKKEYFDDYILFWPLTHDAPRLPMAVHHALRQGAAADPAAPSLAEFVAQARRLADLEALLETSMARGRETVVSANRSLEQAERQIDAALDDFSQQLAAGARPDLVEVRNPTGLANEFQRLKAEQIAQHLRAVDSAVRPMDRWIETLDRDLAPSLRSAHALRSLAARVKRKVLLVEDDPFQHKLVASLLEGAGIELRCVTTGTEALATLRKGHPDLILMDFNLPDIDGVETTRRLKAVAGSADIPVIMITGHAGKEVVVESHRAGACDFLVKPFDKSTLSAKLHKHFGAPAAED